MPIRRQVTGPAFSFSYRTNFSLPTKLLGFELPGPNHYGVAHLFLPREESHHAVIEAAYEMATAEEGLSIIGWRDVPVYSSVLAHVRRRYGEALADFL